MPPISESDIVETQCLHFVAWFGELLAGPADWLGLVLAEEQCTRPLSKMSGTPWQAQYQPAFC